MIVRVLFVLIADPEYNVKREPDNPLFHCSTIESACAESVINVIMHISKYFFHGIMLQ